MRTKALTGLAVLAAGAVTCVAQSNVYSLNIVGYVNVAIQGGNKLTLVSNPLKPSNGDYNITNTVVLSDAADGAQLFRWAGSAWDSTVPIWYPAPDNTWFPDLNIKLGEAFFIKSPQALTITFVGEVSTGTNSYTFAPGLNLVGNKVPVAENFPGLTVGNVDDQIYTWGGSSWDSTVWQFYGGPDGWDNGGVAGNSADGPLVPVGGAVVYSNKGAAVSWTRVFNPE